MTTRKPLMWAGAIVAIGVIVWLAFSAYKDGRLVSLTPIASSTQQTWECNADAKICPDGSSVGRTGPKCEFAACPSPEATSATLTTYLGGSSTSLNVTVNPREIVSDSRCPADVQCIWAGTVEVKAAVSTQVAHGEHVFTLGEPYTFGDFSITLVEATPGKTSEKIPESSYRFTFEVKKR